MSTEISKEDMGLIQQNIDIQDIFCEEVVDIIMKKFSEKSEEFIKKNIDPISLSLAMINKITIHFCLLGTVSLDDNSEKNRLEFIEYFMRTIKIISETSISQLLEIARKSDKSGEVH
jgi:hypothetical protein